MSGQVGPAGSASEHEGLITTKMFLDTIRNDSGKKTLSTASQMYSVLMQFFEQCWTSGIFFADIDLGEEGRRSPFFLDAVYARLIYALRSQFEKDLALHLFHDVEMHDTLPSVDKSSVILGLILS